MQLDNRHDASIVIPMSNETPRRTFRIPANVIQPAKAKAQSQGITLTSVVVNALTEYAKDES